MISEENKQLHIEEEGLNCPYCGNDDIGNAEDFIFGGHWNVKILLKCWCYSCHKTWINVYSLTDVQEESFPIPNLKPSQYWTGSKWIDGLLLFIVLPVIIFIIFSLIVK